MVRKKGKGWKVIIEAGYDKETGKRRRICRTAPTKREAVELESRIRHEVATGAYVPAPGFSVAEFLDRWLADVASVRVGPKTLDDYRAHIELHVKPSLGGVALAELPTAAIQRFRTRLHGEKGLAPASVGLIYRTLRGALNVAMAWKLIRENPARGSTYLGARRSGNRVCSRSSNSSSCFPP
jgi:hypothetical protein